MSDQPQQPTEGWAPREPQAAEEPGQEKAEKAEKAKKPKRPKRTGWRRLIPTWRMVLGAFVVGLIVVAGLFYVGYSMVNIPPANALAMKQSNVYLYSDGSQLARDGEINRENVGLAQISKDAQHAILAAEDRDFYSESAIDPKAMLRAAWNTATGKGKQSGSTITQQYVKNYYLAQEQTVTRKAKEFFISIKLDREKSKDEILEGYLNTSYFGRNAYGIQAAAQAYYGIDAVDLDPARAAYLAALVNAPSEYDVVAHPENKAAAEARWNYVLDGMVKKGWLSESARTGLKFPMPKEQTISTGLSGQRGYIVQAIKDYLTTNKIVTSEQLEAGGYRITTTLDKNKQNAFVKAVNDKVMDKLDKKNNKVDNYVRAAWRLRRPEDRQGRRHVRRRRLRQAVHERRHPRRLPGRLHLQVHRLRRRRPEPLRDPGRASSSPRTPTTTAPTSAPSSGGTAAPTPPRTRTTAPTARSPYARPPTSPSTRCTHRWPSTSAPTRSSRPPSTWASPPTPPTSRPHPPSPSA